MFRQVLLATSMLIAAPVVAQTAPQTDPGRTPLTQTTPTPAPAAPVTTTPAPQTATPMTQATPAPQAATPAPQTATPAPQTATSTPQQATPAAGGTQVTQIIDREFPSYDKNADGSLDATEFEAWMVALRTASDPTTKADSPATRQWLTAAFTQADADKNRGISKTELTGFLSQGQS